MDEAAAKTGTAAAMTMTPGSAVVVVLAGFNADVAPAMIGVGMWVSMEHWFSECVST
jgi:hypothetical protein